MRRLFGFFESVGPFFNLAYWMSLWWMGMIAFLFAVSRNLLRNPDTLAVVFPMTMNSWAGGGASLAIPDWLGRNLLPAAHAAAFLWLALVGWAARKVERRIGTEPLDTETRFQREEAERRSVRWMLRISVVAAWVIPIGAGIVLSFC